MPDNISEHNNSAGQFGVYRCSDCNEPFYQRSSLDSHISSTECES